MHRRAVVLALLIASGCSGPAPEPTSTATQALTSGDVQPIAFGVNWTSAAWGGSIATFFVDVSGDGKADAVALNSGDIRVRLSTGTSFGGTAVSEPQILNSVATANKVFLPAGLEFHVPSGNFHVVTSNVLSNIRPSDCSRPQDQPPTTQANLAPAKDAFNPGCDMGFADFATLPKHQQLLHYVSGRCALRAER